MNCPHCDETMHSAEECPYTKGVCIICGDDTIWACSDCAVDTGKSVHVCKKTDCRDTHESSEVHKR